MAMTDKSVFDNDLINEPVKLLSEYRFFLGDLPEKITIRLYESLKGKEVIFTQSHFINTPVQIDAYRTSRPWNDDESSALHQAIFGFTRFYRDAVNEGHRPELSWLEPNKDF